MHDCGKKHTVLLVDDELVNIKILSDVLKEEYNVVFANSAEEGICRAIEVRPDIILLDVMMPGTDGYEACARLLRQTYQIHGLTAPVLTTACAMLMYAEWHGEYDRSRDRWRWLKLIEAASGRGAHSGVVGR